MSKTYLRACIVLVVCSAMCTAAHAQEVFYYADYFTSRVPEKTKNVREFVAGDNHVSFEEFNENKLVYSGVVKGTADTQLVDAYISYVKNEARDFNYKDAFAQLSGDFTEYYKTKKQFMKLSVVDKRIVYAQVWDADDKELLVNGTGTYTCLDDDKLSTRYIVFRDSLMQECYAVNQAKGDTVYSKVDQLAMPYGGLQEFTQYLVNTVKYPTLARFAGKEGRAYIQFVVDKDGKLTEFTPISNEGYKFESRVISKLEKAPRWKPAQLNGRAVRTAFVLPIVYRLK